MPDVRQPAALPLQTREMPLGSVEASARTIDVTWTTGATVRRRRWIGEDISVPFDEVLLVTDAAVNLARLKAGAPVLDSHMTQTIASQRGVVETAWLAGGRGFARLRFPSRGVDTEADRLFELARQGIVRNISVGYSVDRVRVVAPTKPGEVERRIIERWTPYELSFVTVPADAGAQTRPTGGRLFPLTVTHGSGTASQGVGEAGAACARARMRMRMRAAGMKV
ncbi:hypothetical protein U8607_24120 [Methylobacterium durans]|uniref:hypothetical protein n=1 Tax=Methylobacterium durans TaxID=2202825 RepID=UPI002AFF19E5|nr:hypothetical protein [Methylobacterium durans]MEA1835177.1 hypothetical protein [Methylobacterium durans]